MYSKGKTPASGREDVADTHASGEVVFVNRTTEPVVIPKGTIVRTSSGVIVRFYTVADVEVPAVLYGQGRIGVIAMEPGPTGNVKELTINVIESDVANRVEVLNDSPTRGGDIKRVPIVALQDQNRLLEELGGRLQEEAYEQLSAELAEGEFVPPESLESLVMAQYFHQDLRERADVVSMELKIVVRGIVVDGQALDELATQYLNGIAGEGMALIPGTLYVRRLDLVAEEEGGRRWLALKIAARGMAAPVIAEAKVISAVRGKRVSQAVRWLEERLDLRAEPRITIMPEGWDRLPLLPGRIQVLILASEGV